MDVSYIIHFCASTVHSFCFVCVPFIVTTANKRMVADTCHFERISVGAHVTQGVWQQHAPCNSAGFAAPEYPLISAVLRVAKPYV
jgi:hypothetical protein